MQVSETQKLALDDLAGVLGITTSALARALLFDGVKRVNAHASKDVKESSDHIKLLDARAKL